MGGKSLQNIYYRQKIEINPKDQDCESHSQGPSRKVKHQSKVIRDRKIITKLTRSISSTRIG